MRTFRGGLIEALYSWNFALTGYHSTSRAPIS